MQAFSASEKTTLRKRNFLTDPKVVPYVFIAPFLIFFLVIYLYPFISTILMSFQRIDGPNSVEFIGTANYQRLFNRNFKQALGTTFRYAFWDVVVLTIVPLIFAVILNSGSVKFPAFSSPCSSSLLSHQRSSSVLFFVWLSARWKPPLPTGSLPCSASLRRTG